MALGCPAAGLKLETGQLSRHYIAEISLNVTLNHNQPTIQFNMFLYCCKLHNRENLLNNWKKKSKSKRYYFAFKMGPTGRSRDMNAYNKVGDNVNELTSKTWNYYTPPQQSYYTPLNEVRGGVYWNHPVCPSVRLSVDTWLGKMVSCA